MRILHLEDSEMDHQLACKTLKSQGYEAKVIRVDTLRDYSTQLADQPFDIVLADYYLAGFTAMDAWGITPANSIAPFILLSGAIGEAAAVAAIREGMSDFLQKDDLSQLGRVIDRALKAKNAENEKNAAEKDLIESQRRLSKFADHLQDTIEAERASIAREIHDDIGGSLAAIRLDLGWILRHSKDAGVTQRAATATTMLSHALGASQRIMRSLRPAILDQGLAPAALWLVEGFERRNGIRVSFSAALNEESYVKDVQLAAYRTIQEALTNISKYASCGSVRVDLSDFDGVLTVEVVDDGAGFAESERNKDTAFGLRGLAERARAVGGWLDVSSQPGRGTAIILSVPLTQSIPHQTPSLDHD